MNHDSQQTRFIPYPQLEASSRASSIEHPEIRRPDAQKLTLRDFPSKSVHGVGDREENATGTQVERLRNALAIGVQERPREQRGYETEKKRDGREG